MVKMINAAPFAAFTSAFWGLSLKDIRLQKTLINLIFPCQAMQMMTLSEPGNSYFLSVKSHWKKLQWTAIILIKIKKKVKTPMASSSDVNHCTFEEYSTVQIV